MDAVIYWETSGSGAEDKLLSFIQSVSEIIVLQYQTRVMPTHQLLHLLQLPSPIKQQQLSNSPPCLRCAKVPESRI